MRKIPYYGYVQGEKAHIKRDLPKDIKKHVILHEKLHLKYPEEGEIRINLKAFKEDPKGWWKTAMATIKDPERRKYYYSKIMRKRPCKHIRRYRTHIRLVNPHVRKRKVYIKGFEDFIPETQLKCGCIFGIVDGKKMIITCEKHKEYTPQR